MMAQLGPKHVAERILHKGYRCVKRKTIVLCFKMEHIGTNKVKLLCTAYFYNLVYTSAWLNILKLGGNYFCRQQ